MNGLFGLLSLLLWLWLFLFLGLSYLQQAHEAKDAGSGARGRPAGASQACGCSRGALGGLLGVAEGLSGWDSWDALWAPWGAPESPGGNPEGPLGLTGTSRDVPQTNVKFSKSHRRMTGSILRPGRDSKIGRKLIRGRKGGLREGTAKRFSYIFGGAGSSVRLSII